MITRFDKYENNINEESLPPWVDEKILKPAGEIYKEIVKPLLSIPGNEGDKELDENVKKLFNTPIANIPVYIYAQLMDILDEDRIDELKLEEPLTKDSSMLDVASNYYVFNIANILDSVNKVEASFSSEGIDQETAKILNATPITVGTIIRNSIVNWYASNDVSKKLIESLNTAVIESKDQTTKVTETYEYINESKSEALTKWISKLFKGGEEAKSIAQSAKEASILSKSKGKLEFDPHTLHLNFSKPASSTEEVLTNMSKGSDDFAKNIDNVSSEVKQAVNQKTSQIKSESQAANVKTDIPATDPLHKTKVTDLKSGEPKLPTDRNLPGNNSKTNETKSFWDRFTENLKNKKPKTDKPDKKSFWQRFKELLKNRKPPKKDKNTLFGLAGLIVKIPGMAWTTAKLAALGYGIYWAAKWFEKKDNDSALKPLRELMSTLEDDLSIKGFEPFVTFDQMGEEYKKVLETQDIRVHLKSWITSLNKSRIMSDSDYQKCISQIDSEVFELHYLKSCSSVSNNFVNEIQKQWENHDELPSIGLATMGLASAYSSILHKFEAEFYKGNIPLTADTQHLDRPVNMATRLDGTGQERKYMQIGDEGEDVKLLQSSLSKIGVYTGEVNGKYDEELAKIITVMQTNAKPTTTEIEINGKADLATLNYIAKQIELLSGIVKSSLEGTVSPQEYQKRQQTQGYIQQMQAALANR